MNDFEKYVYIKICVTRLKKLRAHIKEEGKRAYSVTIGSAAWENGRGREHEKIIREKSFKFIGIIRSEFARYFNN